MSRTILIMAGGTGGHIFPGLAVAEVLRARGWQVAWMGNANGMEGKLVPDRGIPLHSVEFGGLRGKGLKTKLMLPANLARAFSQARAILKQTKPDVVLGLGGYISFPGGVSARRLGIPLVLHEQNSVAGMANRWLARVATRTLVAFPGALPKGVWVGNPVSEAITLVTAPVARYAQRRGPLRLLVVGGSLGAKALNEIVPNALGLLPPERRPQVTHQSGRKQIEELEQNYARAGVTVKAVPFIDDMAAAYENADLVVARAGAMTVAELACAGVASILVPYPHAVDDHQTSNARFLSEAGAAILVAQHDLNSTGLSSMIAGFDRETLARMAVSARARGKPDAAQEVARVCEEVAKTRQ